MKARTHLNLTHVNLTQFAPSENKPQACKNCGFLICTNMHQLHKYKELIEIDLDLRKDK